MQLHEQGPAKLRSAADKRIAENKDSESYNDISCLTCVLFSLIAAARWATVKVQLL